MLCKNTVDFIAIAETKLDNSFPNSQFKVQNYELHRSDFTANSGGLLVHIRDDLAHRRLISFEVNSGGFESICIEITIGTSKTVITSLYKHPYVKHDYFKKCFSDLTDRLLANYEDLIYIFDGNLGRVHFRGPPFQIRLISFILTFMLHGTVQTYIQFVFYH